MRPTREPATNNRQNYMVTSETWGRRDLLKRERWAKLFIDTLYHYRGSAYLGFELDAPPQGLKPNSSFNLDGAAEAAPLQTAARPTTDSRRPTTT
jgi:hypothetical protein